MSTVAIELCDPGVALVRSRQPLLESPGYALLERGQSLKLGAEAYAHSRRSPRLIHTRFWDQLGLAELAQPSAELRTVADLASAHVLDLWQRASSGAAARDAALLVVPGSFSLDQLGVLLGVFERCAIPVVGMVDAAVAACTSSSVAVAADCDVVHLEILLHRCVLSDLEIADGCWTLRETHSRRQLGIVSLHETWAKFVAEVFVRTTRFDPLHHAESEQALYDQLPPLLAQLESQRRVPVELKADERSYRVNVERDQLAGVAAAQLRQLTQQLEAARRPGRRLVTLLSARAAALPGVAEALAELRDCDTIALSPGAAGFGALAREAEIRSPDGSIGLVKALRHSGDPAAAVARTATSATSDRPTHALLLHRGYALGQAALSFDASGDAPLMQASGSSPEGFSLCRDADGVWVDSQAASPVLLNGRPIRGRERLHLGDRIQCREGGEAVVLVALAESDGT